MSRNAARPKAVGSKLSLPWCFTKVELRISDAWVKLDKYETPWMSHSKWDVVGSSNKLVQHLCSTGVKHGALKRLMLLMIIKEAANILILCGNKSHRTILLLYNPSKTARPSQFCTKSRVWKLIGKKHTVLVTNVNYSGLLKEGGSFIWLGEKKKCQDATPTTGVFTFFLCL